MAAPCSSSIFHSRRGVAVASSSPTASGLWPLPGGGRRASACCIECRSRKAGATSRQLAVKFGVVALLAGSQKNRTIRPSARFSSPQISRRLQPSPWPFFSSSRSRRVGCNAEITEDQSSGQQSRSSNSTAESGEQERGEEQAAVVSEDGLNSKGLNSSGDVSWRPQNFWSNLKEQHVIYAQDRDRWGVGFSPIFFVHEDVNGRAYQVDVNEEEILARSGVGDGITQFTDDDCRELAKTRLEMAKAHAKDIESGVIVPSPLSVIYKFEKAKSGTASGAASPPWPWETADPASLAVMQFLSFLIVVGSVTLVYKLVKRAFKKKEVVEDPAHEKYMQAMQMRKLQAMRAREDDSDGDKTDGNFSSPHGNGVAESAPSSEIERNAPEVEILEQSNPGAQPAMDDEQFQKKVAQIRAMARKARLREREEAEARSNSERTSLELELGEERDHVLGSQNSNGDGGDVPGREGDENPRSETKSKLNSSTGGVKPRVILSAEEARARIAAKRAKQNGSASTSGGSSKPAVGKSPLGSGLSNVDSGDAKPPSSEAVSSADSIELQGFSSLSNESHKALENSADEKPTAENYSKETRYRGDADASPMEGDSDSPSFAEENDVTRVRNDGDKTGSTAGTSGRIASEDKSNDEVEEMEWMRDDVLREIVFKVQANEEAGREPFHNLDSEQETLFFKGLERKFEREGDEVKNWIKDRVENIDYGADGISIHDPPESYEMKWKEDAPSRPNKFLDRFKEDRERIISANRGGSPTSPSSTENASTPPTPENTPSDSSNTSDATTLDKGSDRRQDGDSEVKTKTVISSSPRAGKKPILSPPSSIMGKDGGGKDAEENWDHTKRWAKELERKYAAEPDPKVRALMREMGQDLDRWITPEEIDAANEMLERGPEGEEEYVKMHYERIKAKIAKQRDTFGRDAMLSKYSEYKEEAEEPELWWLGLPFVVCIGLRATVEGEVQTGLYSIDVGGAVEGVPTYPTEAFHTVAFQDRSDAQNFCTFVNTQPEKLKADGAEPIPFHPKEVYQDAKSEGFKVTVIKKGQLQFSVDTPFEEVEHRIAELGSATYVKDVMDDRVIDMNSVLQDGFGFGRQPQ